jgi:hypothetical protein
MTGYVALIGENRNVYRDQVRKPEVKRPIGRQRYKWSIKLKWILED